MKIKTHYTDGTVKLKRTGKRGDWTRERIALLRQLWKTPTPYSVVAKKISELAGAPITKHACCGKARRLGLTGKPNAALSPVTSEWRSAIAVRAWESRIANGTNKRYSR